MSTQNICNICGANYEYRNGRWKCPACGAYKAEELSNEEVTLFYNAAQKLRLCDFDEAEKAYIDIIEKFPKNANGYWGRLLSRYGIKYEEDFDGRKIPTCYAASIESVLSDKDYYKALELADADTKSYFEQQAQYIERVRKEWIERAKKEKPYDIFICYKDSDLANGIDRTQDSIAAQDLYIHLTEQGYRVFFSRESLRDKVGEKYEPYIFNALSTAKVMLVYGTSSEYITSTWLKNEWTRYEKRLQAGEKKPNSLIIACDGFSPSELPKALSSMQCFDATKRSFYTDLDVVLKRIIKGEKKTQPIITEKKEKKKSKKLTVAIATISALIATFLCILIPNLLNTQPVTSIVDPKYGVVITAQEGGFDKNTTVSVERLSDGTQYESLVSAVNDSKSIELQNAVIYDINCDADIDANVTVKVSYAKDKADSMVKVYYVSDDKATVEEHSCTYDNGSVEFKTTHFSYYVVGEIVAENNDSNDNQGDSNDNQNNSGIGGENTGDDITPPPPEVKEATINFNANGGSGSMPEQTVTVGESTNLKECSYTKSGYTFSGWATSEGGEVIYTDRASFKVESESEITLYAVWVREKFSISFDANGGTGSIDPIEFNSGDSIETPFNTFVKNGYDFIGWSNTKDGTVAYIEGATYTFTSNQTLYAIWRLQEPDKLELIYNANGGTGIMSSQLLLPNQEISLSENVFTRNGYGFRGWSLTPNGEIVYSNMDDFTMGTTSITLYAVWKATDTAIVLNPNGGKGQATTIMSSTDKTITLPLNEFSRDGYTFIGWATTNSEKVIYNNGAEYVAGPNASYNLYAVWKANTNTLYFNANGGSGSMSPMYIQTDVQAQLTENSFTRDGYDFAGWATSPSGNVAYENKSMYTMGTNSSNTLYAVWNTLPTLPETSKFIYTQPSPDCYYISKYNGTDETLMLPTEYNGLPVTGIDANAFFACTTLRSVTIPANITFIDQGAFSSCSNLENAYFAITSKWAKVTEDNPPKFICYVNGFDSSSSAAYHLKNTDADLKWFEDYYSDGLTFNKNGNTYSVASYSGTDTQVIIPSIYKGLPVTAIGNRAFDNCKTLESITIPDSVTSIGEYTFSGCYNLESITIPDSVTSIGRYAFWSCSIESVYITDMAKWCEIDFYDSYSNPLSRNVYGETTDMYLNGTLVTELVIPNTVTSIGDHAFTCCGSLVSVTIPNSVTRIGESAFGKCFDLMNVTIGDSVMSIGDYAFYDCFDLISLTIGNGVKSIGDGAFNGCYNLESITIPDGVTSIGEYTFSGCENLRSVTIPSSVTVIGSEAFYCCSKLESITIPNSITSIEKSTFYGCGSLRSVVIPNSVTSIGPEAFYCCSKLESITIPDSVKSIGKNTFYGCKSLRGVIIPNGVTSIDPEMFYNCSNLESITIPVNITSIGYSSFRGCSNLMSIHFNGTSLQWNAIVKSTYWDHETGSYVVYCTDSTIAKEVT